MNVFEVARRVGVQAGNIRSWVADGLVEQAREECTGGMAVYSMRSVAQANVAFRAKRIGLKTNRLRQFLRTMPEAPHDGLCLCVRFDGDDVAMAWMQWHEIDPSDGAATVCISVF